jgi:hypothetical protein
VFSVAMAVKTAPRQITNKQYFFMFLSFEILKLNCKLCAYM